MTSRFGVTSLLRRPGLAWPVFGLAAGAALYCLAWIATAVVLNSQIESWIARQRGGGATVVHGDPLIGGFPARVVITLPGWDMSRPVTSGDWTWRTTSLRAWSRPWRPLTFSIDLAGRHTLAGVWTPPGVAAWLTFGRADVTPTLLADGQIRAIDIDIADGAVADGAPADAADAPPIWTLAAARVTATPTTTELPDPEPAWRLGAEISSLRFADGLALGPFQPELRRMALEARLIGPIAPGPMTQSLDAWRRGGGTLDLRQFSLDWPPLGMSGSATLALDDRLQPVGAGSIKFKGFFDTVDRLADDGTVRPFTATMARIVLGLMARESADGSGPELNVSISVQDGKLHAGPLTLMDVPPIDWTVVDTRAIDLR